FAAGGSLELVEQQPRQRQDTQHGRADGAPVAAAAGADLALGQPAVVRAGLDSARSVSEQLDVEQFDGVVCLDLRSLREVDVAEVVAPFGGDAEVAAVDEAEFLGGLADAASAERFAVAFVSADEVERLPALVPPRESPDPARG